MRPIKSIFALIHSAFLPMKSVQKGLALPIVLAVLALGALVITPFLSHAGVNLKSSANYMTLIQENNSCEAGVEQVIWALNYNKLADQFSNPGDNVNYSLKGNLNQLNINVDITCLRIEDNPLSSQKGTQKTYQIISTAGKSSLCVTVLIVDNIPSIQTWVLGR
jgi:hypothetical protein